MKSHAVSKDELLHALNELPADKVAEVWQFVEFLRFQLRQPSVQGLPVAQAPETALGWPPGFFDTTFGCLPDLPERAPQGEYENRESVA